MAAVPKPAGSDALINLIYQHLKDSGFEKAANALKKQIPKVPSRFLFSRYTVALSLFQIREWEHCFE